MTWAYSGPTDQRYTQSNEAGQSITAVADGGSNTLTISVTGHGYSAGDAIQVSGTTSYNGSYIINSVTTDTFNINDTDLFENVNTFGSTETGTASRGDGDLTGLTGTGITVDTIDSITEYTIDATRLIVNGLLYYNARTERIRFINVSGLVSPLVYLNTGVSRLVVVSTELVNSTVEVFPSQPALDGGDSLSGFNSSGVGGISFSNSSKGFLQGQFSFSNDAAVGYRVMTSSSSNLTLDNATFLDKAITTNSQVRFQSDGEHKVRNCVLSGCSMTMAADATLDEFSGNVVTQNYESIVLNQNTVGGYQEFIDFEKDNAGVLIRHNSSGNVQHARFVNYIGGAVISYTNNDAGSDFNRVASVKEIVLAPEDESGSGITATYYAVDTDNSNRGPDYTENSTGTSYTCATDNTYTGSTSGETIEVVVAFANQDGTIDNRGENASGDITFRWFTYGRGITSVRPSMLGVGSVTSAPVMLPDASITEATKATVDAYTELETPQKFYDRAAAYLEDNWSTLSAFLLSRSGDTIDAGSYNIIIDATATPAFALSGTTITIHADTFTGNINTSGTVVLSNGSRVQGLINGSFLAEDGDTLSTVYAKVQVNTATIATVTLDGIIIPEFEILGGGALTIDAINNGKAPASQTTLTQTSGTITLDPDLIPSANYTEDTGAGTITLTTGTEADLTGLRGLIQVDYTVNGSIATYTTGAQIIISSGATLNQNPDTEILNLTYDGEDALMVNGTYNYGVLAVVNSVNVYSQGSGLVSVYSASGATSQWMTVSSTGTFLWNGGTIIAGAAATFEDGATTTINAGVYYNAGNIAVQVRFEATGANVSLANVNDLVLDGGGSQSRLWCAEAFNNAVFTLKRGEFQTNATGSQTLTFRDFNLSSNANSSDIAVNSNDPTNAGTFEIINTNKLPVINAPSVRSDYFRVKRDITFNFIDSGGSDVGVYSVYGVDTDNGSRFVGPRGEDDTGNQVYSAQDTSGPTNFDVLWYIFNFEEGRTPHTYLDDRRNGSSQIPINAVGYGYNIATIVPELINVSDLSLETTLITDIAITETVRATVDAYTAIDNARELYDRAKSEMVTVYAGETSTTVTRTGTQIDLLTKTLTVNGDGATVFDITGSALTIKSTNYTGGFSNGTISHGTGSPTFTNLVLENATWNANQATWTGSADATTTIDVANAGTYDATGFTFDASSTLNNSSGGTINIVISSGQQQPTVTGGGTTNFINAGATVTFNNLTSSNVQIVEDDDITVAQRSTSQTGTLVYNTPDGSSGTWSYVINRAGYDPIIGSFTADGDDVTVDATQTQKQTVDGDPLFTEPSGLSSAFLSVVPLADGSRMNLRVSNGKVTPQQVFDEVENALQTQDGMSYLCNGGGQVDFVTVATGAYLFLKNDVRVIRDSAGDANAEIGALISSTDGQVLDATNGSVIYGNITSDVNIVSVNGTNTTNIDDFKANVSALATSAAIAALNDLSSADVATELATYDAPTKAELDTAQAAIIAQVDANEVKIDALETKAQADARQALIAKEATKFDPAVDVVANVTLVDTVTTNTDMRGTDGANTVAPDNASLTAILADTNELQTNQGNWLTATGFSTHSAADVWAVATRSLTDKVDFALSTASITAIEAALLNEGDGQQLIDAILQVINSNLDLPALELQAIATQVRTELATELARIDADVSSRATQANVAAELATYDAPTKAELDASQVAIIAEVDANETKIDALETKAARLDALIENSTGDRFTAKALETAPTDEMSEAELHTALDNYTNKGNWMADVSALALEASLLDTADIDARLTAYGAPTLTEMTSAFTEIKGATWTTGDTLEAIKDAVTSGAITVAEVWDYATRTVTGGTIDTNNDMRGTDSAALPADVTAAQSAITTETDAIQALIGALQDLSTADVDARLAAYDAPTFAEMVAAFTEIKGAGWVSQTLVSLKESTGLSDADVDKIWDEVL